MFGENLRSLSRDYPSISDLARRLGINRTQFNRYLAGESFPRPDVLARICDFFDVDARVLLDPVDSFDEGTSVLSGPELCDFLGPALEVSEAAFPSGFFRFTRKSFLDQTRFAQGLVWVWRGRAAQCFLRGYEAREAMAQQGLPVSAPLREFRGLVLRQENAITINIARRGAMTASFNMLQREASFQNNFWVGYVARTVPESPSAQRVVRMVYEHLGRGMRGALPVARKAGLVAAGDVPPFHRRMLQDDVPFR